MLCTGVGGPPAGGGGYTAQGVYFDDTTGTFRTGNFTGITGSKVGTVSFWFKMVGNDGVGVNVFGVGFGSGGAFTIDRRSPGNVMEVVAQDATATNILIARSTSTFVSANGWKHVIASWNLATTTFQLFVEDVDDTPAIVTNTNAMIDYTGGSGSSVFFTGLSSIANFDIADFWFDPTTFNDLTNTAFRRKFISAGLAPVDLGTTCQLPTGSQPIGCFKGPTTNFLTNAGSGGNFTTFSGALQAAGSNPP